jgi:hypothetical protein
MPHAQFSGRSDPMSTSPFVPVNNYIRPRGILVSVGVRVCASASPKSRAVCVFNELEKHGSKGFWDEHDKFEKTDDSVGA